MNLMRFLLRSSRSVVIVSAIAGAAGGAAGIALIALIQRELRASRTTPCSLAWAFFAALRGVGRGTGDRPDRHGEDRPGGDRGARPAPRSSYAGAPLAGVRDDRQLGPAVGSDR